MSHPSLISNGIREVAKVLLTLGLTFVALVFVTTSQAGALAQFSRTEVASSITFVITPTAGLNGSILPATPQTVALGANQSFTITPDIYYAIRDVGVDGVSHGPIHYYTFDNVTTDHTITATFAQYDVTLTLKIDGTGSGIITPTTGSYRYLAGDVVTLRATAAPDSMFKGWYYLKYVITVNPLTFTIQTDMMIFGVFLLKHNVYIPLVLK